MPNWYCHNSQCPLCDQPQMLHGLKIRPPCAHCGDADGGMVQWRVGETPGGKDDPRRSMSSPLLKLLQKSSESSESDDFDPFDFGNSKLKIGLQEKQFVGVDFRSLLDIEKEPFLIKSRGQPKVLPYASELFGSLKVVGLNERSTSFIRNPRTGGTIAVLGWDHAMVIQRLLGHYCVTHIWAHCPGKSPSQQIFLQVKPFCTPVDTSAEKPVLLEHHDCRSKGCAEGCRFIRIKVKPIRIERWVTFQASSCSVAILRQSGSECLVISHMDAAPTVPVAQMYLHELSLKEVRSPSKKLSVISSVFPEKEEVLKVMHSCSLLRIKPVFLLRGPLGNSEKGPVLGWSNLESGMEFPPLMQAPSFCGVIGAFDVYRNLLSKEFIRIIPKIKPWFWEQEMQAYIGGIPGLADELVENAYHQLMKTSQFAEAHTLMLSMVATMLLEAASGEVHKDLAKSAQIVLEALVGKKKNDYFPAAIRALMLYGFAKGQGTELVVAVETIVEWFIPELQLRFTITLTDEGVKALVKRMKDYDL